jgi:hypothetical protein
VQWAKKLVGKLVAERVISKERNSDYLEVEMTEKKTVEQ